MVSLSNLKFFSESVFKFFYLWDQKPTKGNLNSQVTFLSRKESSFAKITTRTKCSSFLRVVSLKKTSVLETILLAGKPFSSHSVHHRPGRQGSPGVSIMFTISTIYLALDFGASFLLLSHIYLLAACWLRNVLHPPEFMRSWPSQSRNSFLLPLPQTSCPQWHVTRPISCCTLSDLHETRVKGAQQPHVYPILPTSQSLHFS